jgi:hypothetical protein
MTIPGLSPNDHKLYIMYQTLSVMPQRFNDLILFSKGLVWVLADHDGLTAILHKDDADAHQTLQPQYPI